jgi:transposase
VAVLAAWPHETHRLPPQRPQPARPPGVRGRPHAGRSAVCRGHSQAEVARQLGVARQNVSRWRARWRHGGLEALHSAGPTRPDPRLPPAQLTAIDQALRQGARANGFDTDHWTLARITTVIEQTTGVGYHPGHT